MRPWRGFGADASTNALINRDPLASSRKRAVSTSGLHWVVLTLVVTPPWTARYWALPILSVPAANVTGQ